MTIFINVDETFLMDPIHVKEILTRSEKIGVKIIGIIPVHLYEYHADMDSVFESARRHQLFAIEDLLAV